MTGETASFCTALELCDTRARPTIAASLTQAQQDNRLG